MDLIGQYCQYNTHLLMDGFEEFGSIIQQTTKLVPNSKIVVG